MASYIVKTLRGDVVAKCRSLKAVIKKVETQDVDDFMR